VGDPHDEPDDLAIQEAVRRIVQPPGEDGQPARPPGGAAQEGPDVGVAVGRVLARLARDDVDREEGAGHAVQRGAVGVDEAMDVGPVTAVADAGADDDLVERRELGRRAGADLEQLRDLTVAAEHVLDPAADGQRVAVDGGVGDERSGHGRSRLSP
jgi:hypothetical protein